MEFTAAILRDGGHSFTMEEVVLGTVRDDEVLVRLVATGVCHSDVVVRDGKFPVPRPIILGHEGSGVVERVGAAVTKVRPGDPVVLSYMFCGSCGSCRTHAEAYCDHTGPINFSGLRPDGSSALSQADAPVGGHFFGQSSFAQFSVANERNVVKVRADAPLDLLGPFGCGFQTGAGSVLNVLKPETGSSIAIIGGGGVGLSAAIAATVAGCDRIIVVEPRAARRALALEVGATHAIDPAAGDFVEAIKTATGGNGADCMFDTSGNSEVIGQAMNALASRGVIALVALSDPMGAIAIPIFNLISRGLSVRGVVEGDSHADDFIPYLIDLYMDGRLPVDKLVKFYDFAALNQAFEDQVSGATIKPIVRFV